jgi:MinD-like ATPase involved in chromosome partitioning or flagellar assembly
MDLPVAGAGDVSRQLLVPDHVPDDLVDTSRASNGSSVPAPGPDPLSPFSASLSDGDDGPGWQPRGSEADAAPSTDADHPTRSTIIAVWGPTGGPGRTTLAVNLAAEIASRSREVLLVDADTYGGSVAQVLGLLDEAPGIAAACRAADHGTLDLPGLARLAPLVMPGLRVLTGLPKAERWPELRAAALERVLELGRGLAQVIVVDCGFCIENDEELSYDTAAPRRNEATLTTLAGADTVLAVGSADPVGLQRFVRALQELGSVPSPPPVPVINRVRSSAVGSRPEERIAESLLRFAGLDGLHFLPDDAATVDAALLAGRSVVEHARDSALGAAFAELATEVAPWTQTRVTGRQRRLRRARAAG